MKKIIAVIYPGCIFFEISLALELLVEKFEIEIISPDENPLLISNGTTIIPNKSFTEATLDDCHAILVPGVDPNSFKDNTDIDTLIRVIPIVDLKTVGPQSTEKPNKKFVNQKGSTCPDR